MSDSNKLKFIEYQEIYNLLLQIKEFKRLNKDNPKIPYFVDSHSIPWLDTLIEKMERNMDECGCKVSFY